MALCYRDLGKGDVIVDRGVREGFIEVGYELDLDEGAEFGLIKKWDEVYHVERKSDEPRIRAGIQPIGID